MRFVSSFFLIVAVAASVGGCAQQRTLGYFPEFARSVSQQESTDVPWEQCLSRCRAQIVRDVCPTAPAFDPDDPRLMNFVGSRERFEAGVAKRCEINRASSEPVRYAQAVGYRPPATAGRGIPYCAKLGSPAFLRDNPKPAGREGCQMVQHVPGKPCGGWWCPSVIR
jgi:hypothetical protein